jgi:chlorite dismutase
MNKRRGEQENWYRLSFEERKQLMSGHARVGRQYSGRVRQLITGATGLDDWEWGVTLLAHDIFEVKSIVYEMRFDEVSARFAEFGEFFIGLQLPLDQLFQRLLL